MTRVVLPRGAFSANRIGQEPASTIVGLDWWSYLGTDLASSPNMVDDVELAETGTVTFASAYCSPTPGTNYLEPVDVLDVADQTFVFVAKTAQTGGNYSPIITAYPGAVGVFIALGWTYLRIHAAGFGAIGNYSVTETYGNEWGFWSVILDSGHATPIRIKNHTYGATATGGTAAGTRSSTGTQVSIARHTIATFGTFTSDIAFVGRAQSVMTDAELLTCYDSVRFVLAELNVAV